MLDNTRRVLFALSLSALLLACSSKDEAKPAESEEPAAAPAPSAQPTDRRMMKADHIEKAVPVEAGEGAEAAEAAAPPSGLIPKFEKLAEKACACKDKGCANKVQDELGQLTGELGSVQDNEKQQIGVVMQKLTKCIQDAQQ